MKLLSFFLALLVLALTCMPCSDSPAATYINGNITTTGTATEHQHPAGDTHEDLCSPFCQCACCALACTIPAVISSPPVRAAAPAEKPLAFLISGAPVHMAVPVWQPPQLS